MDAARLNSLLLEQHEEFRVLHLEHQRLQSTLDTLTQKAIKQAWDEIESRRIKKQKLALKDRMQRIAADFRHAGGRPLGGDPE